MYLLFSKLTVFSSTLLPDAASEYYTDALLEIKVTSSVLK